MAVSVELAGVIPGALSCVFDGMALLCMSLVSVLTILRHGLLSF